MWWAVGLTTCVCVTTKVDSDEEWEEPEAGESLSGPDDDEEEGSLLDASGKKQDALDYDDGWLVTDDVIER